MQKNKKNFLPDAVGLRKYFIVSGLIGYLLAIHSLFYPHKPYETGLLNKIVWLIYEKFGPLSMTVMWFSLATAMILYGLFGSVKEKG